ncbi:MAG: hypothetical protein R3C14_37615 [Caldilineaceae bacterium]
MQRTVETPIPTRALAPTFTPTSESVLPPVIVITPPQNGTPGVIVIPPGVDLNSVLPATSTPTPVPETPFPALTSPPGEVETGIPPEQTGGTPATLPVEAPPTFTETPIPPTFTPIPTPYIIVDSGLVSLRTGPGVEYPLIAQLGPKIPIAIVGRDPEGEWYKLCCVNGSEVWVATSHVRTVNDVSGIALLTASEPPPPPTPTPPFTETPTVTPTPTATLFPFERAIGPQFFPTNNEFLTIWVKLFVGLPPAEPDPADGYYLKVFFEGVERPSTNGVQASAKEFKYVGVKIGTNTYTYGNLQYNLKYEYMPPDPKKNDPNTTETRLTVLGTGNWKIYVADGAGNQLSDAVEFRTEPTNANREIYVAWVRVR